MRMYHVRRRSSPAFQAVKFCQGTRPSSPCVLERGKIRVRQESVAVFPTPAINSHMSRNSLCTCFASSRRLTRATLRKLDPSRQQPCSNRSTQPQARRVTNTLHWRIFSPIQHLNWQKKKTHDRTGRGTRPSATPDTWRVRKSALSPNSHGNRACVRHTWASSCSLRRLPPAAPASCTAGEGWREPDGGSRPAAIL